jgi:hypothetical protein
MTLLRIGDPQRSRLISCLPLHAAATETDPIRPMRLHPSSHPSLSWFAVHEIRFDQLTIARWPSPEPIQ